MNGPHRFSLRGSNTASPDRGKTPELWPMPERAKSFGEHSEDIFLPTRRKFVPPEIQTLDLVGDATNQLGRPTVRVRGKMVVRKSYWACGSKMTVHFGQQAELRMRYIPYLHNSTSILPYYRMVQEEKNIADRQITWM